MLQGIDIVNSRVQAMVVQLESVDFNVFEKAAAAQWQAAKQAFMSSSDQIKEATRELIDTSFRCAWCHNAPMQADNVHLSFSNAVKSLGRLAPPLPLKADPLDCFTSHCRKLRSAEAAFELLENFKSIKSQGAIRKQMMNKMNDILQQFSREIDATAAIFESMKVSSRACCWCFSLPSSLLNSTSLSPAG